MPRTTIFGGMIAGELKSPPPTWPTLITAVSVAGTFRLTIVWIAMTNCAVTIVTSVGKMRAGAAVTAGAAQCHGPGVAGRH